MTNARILAITCDASTGDALVRRLGSTHRLDVVSGTGDGVARAVELRPELILAELDPDVVSGEVVHLLRERRELDGTPILIVGVEAQRRSAGALLREGAQDFVAHPFGPELEVRLSNWIAMKRATDESTRLRDREEHLRFAAEASGLGTFAIAFDASHSHFSPGFLSIFGVEADSVEASTIDVRWLLDRIHPEDRPRVCDKLDACVSAGLPGDLHDEHRIVLPDGTVRWVLLDARVHAQHATDAPLHCVGTVLDVTAQKRTEGEQKFLADVGAVLAASLEYEETLTSIAELAVRSLADFCVVDVLEDDGELRRLKVASRDPQKAWACDVLTRIPLDPDRPHLVWSVLEARGPILLEGPPPEKLASFSQTPDHLRALEAVEPHSIIGVPLLAHGKLFGAIALVSSAPSRTYTADDVRLAEELARRAASSIENARLYRAAQRAVRARDEVLGIVAHDLRNPLGTIMMQAALLRNVDLRDDLEPHDPVRTIERAANRMNHLIQDLLDVTRMEAGHLTIEPERVCAADVVRDSVDAHAALAKSHGLDVVLELSGPLPDLWSDPDRLHQILENLIGNALKFNCPGGRVAVGASARRGEVLFWVANTGSGIAPEDIPHLFDRFWQTKRGRRTGAGLGLPIAKGIVEAHGGKLWVQSEPARGATFFFTIPTVQPDEQHEGRAADAD